MDRIIQSPGKYIQGAYVIDRLGEHLASFAERFFVIADDFVLKLVKARVEKSLQSKQLDGHFERFNGECSRNEISRLQKIAETEKYQAIIGIGGGKTLDTAKALAFYLHLPVIIVPTLASTDAPCSALAVLYTDNGEFDSYLFFPRNPDCVIVDSQLISQAPSRLLAAGIGDALATYFEALACSKRQNKTMVGGLSTCSALQLAELCYDILQEDGYKAYLAVEQKVVTEALERVIEANTYLSGIGFESGGLAAAHAIHNGFTALEETHQFYHGEKVAYGTITQLILENADQETLNEVILLCRSVNLPTSLADLNIKNDIAEKLHKVAKLACAKEETIHNMPFIITEEKVYAALLIADSYSRHFT